MFQKNGKMLVGLVIVVIVLVFGVTMIVGYNSLVDKDETVDTKAAAISIALTERFDKINGLLTSIEGLEEHALNIYTAITNARQAFLDAQASGDMEALAEADQLQSIALSDLRAFMLVEDNPNISALPGYMVLMDEIISSEGELAYARSTYNNAIDAYNKAVRRFPNVMFAAMFGFERDRVRWDEVPGVE